MEGLEYEKHQLEKAKLNALQTIAAELKTLNETLAAIGSSYEVVHHSELND